jgi:hypothetical protein
MKRFRAACDEFFQRKAEFFKNIQSTETRTWFETGNSQKAGRV